MIYFLTEMTKQHNEALLKEAELAREIQRIKASRPKARPAWRNWVGDLLINSGLRLKGQVRLNHKRGPSIHTA
jgi:hypothetical protein